MHHVQKWVEKIRVVESAQGFMSLKELVAEGFVALRRRQFQMIAGKGSKLSSLKTTSSHHFLQDERKNSILLSIDHVTM
jgi:hypothetical protein